MREKYLFREARKVLSGNVVKEWAGLSYWGEVKTVTDATRVRILDGINDGDGDWREEMIKLSDGERKALALKLKEALIQPRPAQDTAVPA